MTDCEFEKECKRLNPKEIRQFIGEHCGWETSEELDGCLYRKFAILVRNRALVEYQEYIDRCVETWKRAVGSRMGANQKEFVSRVREKGDFLKMEVP